MKKTQRRQEKGGNAGVAECRSAHSPLHQHLWSYGAGLTGILGFMAVLPPVSLHFTKIPPFKPPLSERCCPQIAISQKIVDRWHHKWKDTGKMAEFTYNNYLLLCAESCVRIIYSRGWRF